MPFHYGQATLAAGTAQPLTTVASRISLKYIVIKALPGNAAPLFVGDATVTNLTGYILSTADQEVRIDAPGGEFLNTNDIYILGTIGEGVSWIGG